jgi:hypothetical protein
LISTVDDAPRHDIESGQGTLDFNNQLEELECARVQSDSLSLNSFALSDTSHRWSVSSFVPSIETYMSAEFSTNGQYSDAPASMQGTGAGSHNSIDSIVLSERDLNILANCESLNYNIDQNDSNTWWPNDVPQYNSNEFLPGTLPAGEIQLEIPALTQISEAVLSQPAEEFQEDISLPLGEFTDFTNDTLPEVSEGSMDWEFSHVADTMPDYEGQDIIPLTDEQKETLVKWWGRNRLTEAPSSLFGKSKPSNFQSKPVIG